MTKALPFTKASIRRAIDAAREAGLRVTAIRPDGTVLVEEGGHAPTGQESQDAALPPPGRPIWDDVEA